MTWRGFVLVILAVLDVRDGVPSYGKSGRTLGGQKWTAWMGPSRLRRRGNISAS